ncbi:trichoplein keratin filament-binding protein isoform X3 [Candoia aspera]|uniref:trichoplein keratin filament-binding protein isoform X3 n=1 Tax=Candoia aspera TaxID=51853 RepID=UPI002FD85E21
MALPAAPPFWGSRSRALERQIVRQREQEARLRRQWELHSLSFRQAGLRSRKQAEWSSRRSFQQSMEAHGRERLKAEKAAGLERRRRQLRELLFREREGLAAELRALRPGGGAGLEEQRRRGEELRSAREERRKQVAEERLYECWKNSSAKLRELEAADREEKLRSENRYERARQEALERLKQEEKRRKQEEEKQAEFLLQQMEALQLREVEATKLKEEEENLLKQRWELQALKAERKLEDERRRKVELGCFLKHQYHAQLRRRAQQVQEELEKDRRILLALSEKDNEDQRLQSVRQEEAMATAAWMRAVVEQQLQLEREREAELETVFREEAKQVWERREEEWESERKARDRLMAEVLAERAQQIQEKVEQNRQAQQESVMLREQLIQELEEAKRLTQQEQEEVAEQKTARKQELQAQLTERQLREEEERQHQRDVAAEAQLQAQHNERLEALEARRMAEAGYHSQSQGRPKSAWT